MSTVSPPPSNSSKENNSNIQKPPTKPRTRSNYHLESNPFEVSFSQPHTSPTIPTFAPPSPRLRSASGDGIESKPKLPPITAMASPAAAGDFAWAFGNGGTADVNSLRSGPLSPAMLAGPAQYSTSNGNPAGGPGAHHGGPGSGYDVMRTGLTPDVNRTGLTPLIGGPTSFPPPSPNTAAFIAMVTNQNNAAAVGATGQNGPDVAPATITPGTFSAITGALINNSNGPNGENGESTSPTSTHNPHHHPHRHPLSVSHVPDGVTDMNDDAAHTAANGLFLLSQAHHELTKREEQQQQQLTAQRQAQQQQLQPTQTRSTSSRDRSNSSPSTKRKITSASNDSNKRARASARAAPSRGGGRRKRSEEMSSNGDDDDDEQDDVDNDDVSDDEELEAAARVGTINASTKGHGSSSTPTKKPETEEEKRKNFLERNRQAALKCRQRKKAWLNQLQAKVEYLTTENERLQNTTVSMREEISRLSAVVVAHRDCGLGGVSVARSEALLAGTASLTTTRPGGAGLAADHAGVNSTGGDSGVPSNAPPATTNGASAREASGITTRGRRGTQHASSASPVPPPQMVTVGGSGGGKGGRYGGY